MLLINTCGSSWCSRSSRWCSWWCWCCWWSCGCCAKINIIIIFKKLLKIWKKCLCAKLRSSSSSSSTSITSSSCSPSFSTAFFAFLFRCTLFLSYNVFDSFLWTRRPCTCFSFFKRKCIWYSKSFWICIWFSIWKTNWIW